MNKLCCLIGMFFACGVCEAQILCIYCYDQNDTISANVNNLVLNGGFENGCTHYIHFCPNSTSYACDITNWTCTGGGSNTYASLFDNNDLDVVEGNYAAYFGNWRCNSCSAIANDTSCINNNGCTVSGIPNGYPVSIYPGYGDTAGVSLEQTINGLIPGNTYVLEFWAGGEAAMTKSGLFAVNVGFGNTFLRDKHTGTTSVDSIGKRYIIEFNATSSSHTIKFTNWGHICAFCTELILDDVRLYTLAELDASVPHCSLGFNNVFNSLNSFSIYPNPLTNDLNIKINNSETSEIILYDIFSRKLLQKSFTNSTLINTEQLAKGIYLYEVRNKNGVIKKGKVVKD